MDVHFALLEKSNGAQFLLAEFLATKWLSGAEEIKGENTFKLFKLLRHPKILL